MSKTYKINAVLDQYKAKGLLPTINAKSKKFNRIKHHQLLRCKSTAVNSWFNVWFNAWPVAA